MTIAVVSIVFDCVLAGLLAAMIYYAVRLNQRIVMLRAREDELTKMFESLAQAAESTVGARQTAEQLRSAGTEAEVSVKAAVAKANAMRGDLELMIDQAVALIDKIEEETERQASIRMSAEKASAAAPSRPVARRPAAGTAPAPAAPVRPEAAPPFPPMPEGRERIPALPETPRRPSSDIVEARTDAERNLLAAIRAAKEGVA